MLRRMRVYYRTRCKTANLIILSTNSCKGILFLKIQNQYNGSFWQCIGVGSIEACNCNKIIWW